MSRLRRTSARVRQMAIALRTNPYVEKVEAARHRHDEDPEEAEPAPRSAGGAGGGGDDGDPPTGDDNGEENPDHAKVSRTLRVAAGWAWRAAIVAAAIYGALWLAGQLAIVVVPLLISILLAAMFQPMAAFLIRHRWPPSLAAATVLVGGLAAVVGTMIFVVQQFIESVPEFTEQVETGIDDLEDWLKDGPVDLTDEDIETFLDDAQESITGWAQDNSSELATQAVDVFGTAVNVLTVFLSGFFLVLFLTFFFIRDGRKMWTFLVGMLPRDSREPMRQAGDAAWRTLVSYVRTTILVAFVDAVGIGIGLYLLDVPMWLALATLTFIAAFVPIVGATVAGAAAVLVALVGTEGTWVTALAVLGVVLLVQQIESNVLQPFLMSRAVKLHPVAVILAVGIGVIEAGIFGAVIAVPILAVANTGIRHLVAMRDAREAAEAGRAADTAETETTSVSTGATSRAGTATSAADDTTASPDAGSDAGGTNGGSSGDGGSSG